MADHISGLELSRRLHSEAVRPALSSTFTDLPYAAALLGRGSEVLGYDDEMSTDHDWHARVVIFLGEDDAARHEAVTACLRRELPPLFEGHPVSAEVSSVHSYFRELLGIDVRSFGEPRDWLSVPEHALRMATGGAVHHDEVGLGEVRGRLAYYPRDVWLYLLICGWWRVHPEVNLVGRTGWVGDELGSTLLGSRLVTDLMRLCFLIEREYAPYSKWFGTAFARLRCGPVLLPLLRSVVRAQSWQEREAALLAAYEAVVAIHNASGLTQPVTTTVERLWERPFDVAWADIPAALHALIEDPQVLAMSDTWPVGPVDQLRDLLWPARTQPLVRRFFPT